MRRVRAAISAVKVHTLSKAKARGLLSEGLLEPSQTCIDLRSDLVRSLWQEFHLWACVLCCVLSAVHLSISESNLHSGSVTDPKLSCMDASQGVIQPHTNVSIKQWSPDPARAIGLRDLWL